jgi:hypothetical protein
MSMRVSLCMIARNEAATLRRCKGNLPGAEALFVRLLENRPADQLAVSQ